MASLINLYDLYKNAYGSTIGPIAGQEDVDPALIDHQKKVSEDTPASCPRPNPFGENPLQLGNPIPFSRVNSMLVASQEAEVETIVPPKKMIDPDAEIRWQFKYLNDTFVNQSKKDSKEIWKAARGFLDRITTLCTISDNVSQVGAMTVYAMRHSSVSVISNLLEFLKRNGCASIIKNNYDALIDSMKNNSALIVENGDFCTIMQILNDFRNS